MFGALKAYFGIVSAHEKNGIITINGIPAEVVKAALETLTQLKKINKYIFLPTSSQYQIKFYSFYAVEIQHLLHQLSDRIKSYRIQRIAHKCIEELKKNTWLANIDRPDIPPIIDLSRLDTVKWSIKPHQLAFLEGFGSIVPRYELRGMLLAASPGTGKALTLDTLIKIPGDWIPMGEIKIGDSVIARDGSTTTVIGVYPQEPTLVYRMTFVDNRSVDICGEHLWKCLSRDDGGHPIWTIRTTLAIKQRLDQGSRLYIPLIDSEQGRDQPLPEDPYLLGRSLSHDSFIPDDYLLASTPQRLALLQALMDTNGIVDPDNLITFRSANLTLAQQIQYLVRSLGGIATLFIPHINDAVYHVNIQLKNPQCLFRLSHQKSRVQDSSDTRDLKLRIKSVEKIGYRPTQCIAVDHPEKLFVVKDFVVTHNTFTNLALAACLIPPSVAEIKIIVSPKNAIELVWQDTVETVFKEKPTDWVSNVPGPAPLGKEYYIFHYEALDRAQDLVEELTRTKVQYITIIDESHNFNTIGSLRTDRLIKICKIGGGYSVWSSGSPIKALGIEIIPTLRAIDPKFTPAVEQIFKKIFGGDEEAANEILYTRIGLISYKVPAGTVAIEAPVPVKIRVKLRNPKPYLIETVRAEMKAYIEQRLVAIQKDIRTYKLLFEECLSVHRRTLKSREQHRNFDIYMDCLNKIRRGDQRRPDPKLLGWCKNYEEKTLLPSLSQSLQRQFKEVRSVVKTLLLKVRGEALGRILAKRRAECAAELAKHCNLEEIIGRGEGKTMVFSSYQYPLEEADRYLKNLGFQTANVYGDTAKFVTQIVRKFHDNSDVNPIMATYMSLSTAVPVTVANQIVMLDMPYRQYIYSQTVARAARLGQTKTVYVYEILLDTGEELNVSTRSAEIIAWSRKNVAELMGDSFSGPEDDDYLFEDYNSEDALKNLNE